MKIIRFTQRNPTGNAQTNPARPTGRAKKHPKNTKFGQGKLNPGQAQLFRAFLKFTLKNSEFNFSHFKTRPGQQIALKSNTNRAPEPPSVRCEAGKGSANTRETFPAAPQNSPSAPGNLPHPGKAEIWGAER